MRRSVFTASFREQRVGLAWWSLGLVALVAITLAFWPTIKDQGEMLDQIIAQYPPELLALFGANVADLASPAGYLESQLYGFMLPALFLVYAIGRGTRAIAGEEEAGTLDILLAEPVTRHRLVLEKALGLAAAVLALALVLLVSLAAGILLVDMDIALGRVVAVTVLAALLAILFGFLALMVGAVKGRRGLAIGIPAGVAVLAYFVNGLAPLAEWSDGWERVSPFHYYLGGDPLRDGLDPWHALVLVGASLVLLGVAMWAFDRRDVGT